jgi:hypothetical protein
MQRFLKALLPVGDQAEKMKGFCMLWRELESLTVGRFCLPQPMRLLMDSSLFKPGLDRRR